MAITGVGGFFGKRSRQRKPAGVDIVFTTDQSGSMGQLIDFINASSTVVALETALLAENVGILVPNRYSNSTMQNLYRSAGGDEWELGSDLIATPASWDNWVNTGYRWGQSQEDVTGSVFRIANTGFPYGYDSTTNPASNGSPFEDGTTRAFRRGTATQIVIAGSDEQGGATQTFPDQVYSQITNPATGVRYVALSSVSIAVSTTIPQDIRDEAQVFGVVFTTPSTWIVIMKPNEGGALDPNTPLFYEVPSNSITFRVSDGPSSGTVDPSPSGPIILPGTQDQLVNTPKLALGSGGAIYNIQQFFSSNGPTVFGASLGLVLGRFLYGLE